MILLVYVLAGLAILLMALRFSRFRSQAERVLTVAAVLGLLVVAAVWLREGQTAAEPQVSPAGAPAIGADQIAVADLIFTRERPETSYRVTGTVTNDSAVPLDYFRLTVTLDDCAAQPCMVIGTDTALVIARARPGKSLSFETFFTIPNPEKIDPVNPRWSTTISDIRARK